MALKAPTYAMPNRSDLQVGREGACARKGLD